MEISDFKLPEGVTLEKVQNFDDWFSIKQNGNTVGEIVKEAQPTYMGGGYAWDSRGLERKFIGAYDTGQEALDASLRDSGILVDPETPDNEQEALDEHTAHELAVMDEPPA